MATELPTLGLQMMGAFPAPVQIAQGGAGFDISALFPPGAALAMTGFGPNVLPVGDFSGGIGYWTVSGTDGTHSVTFAGATMRYQSGATSPVLNLQSPAAVLEIGKTYRVTTNTSAFTSGSLKIDHSGGSTVVANAAGSKSGNIVANSTVLTMLRNSANVDLTLNAISVQKVVASLPALVSLSGGTLVAASGAGASAENTYAVQVTYLGQTKAYTFNMAVS